MTLITKNLNNGITADQLAQFIIGDTGSVVAGSVKFTGDNRAVGAFGGGISEQLNVEAGVIFSTGDIASANGPNNSDGTGTGLGKLGDADLNVLIAATGFTTNDAAVLEFDFIPKQSQFAIEYVFASEEYNEYIGKYNDVFGFFVNGVNTPLVPGTTQPVSIDTINGTKNKAFYFNNDFSEFVSPPYQTQFDGFTAVLTAQGATIPNVPNRLKLAIADTKDSALDSAVFISALPLFNFSQPTYQVKEDGTVVGATITINRSGITNATSNVDVKFSNGSATGGATLGLGVDFVFTTQTITFAANQTTATISVPINNDSLVEPTENLTLTLANPQNGIIGIAQNTATLEILDDNDTAGIIITSTGGADVAEGGTSDTYTVVLQSQPSNLVIVTLDPDTQTDLGTGTGVPLTLNFTPNNWNVPQTVTIAAVDDKVAEASPHTSAIAHKVSSVDPNYDGAAVPITIDGTATATLTANITDNDTPSVKITETGGTTKIGEGGNSDSYTVELTTEPTADVTTTLTPDAQSDLGAGAGTAITFTFTPANWNAAQTVTVQAVDDAVVEANPHTSQITHTASSTDAKYNLISIPAVSAQITDNDSAGVTVAPVNTNAAEGGETVSYKLALTSKPTAPVKVNFNTGIQIDSISSFTFTSDNWDIPQVATVKATDDSIVEGLHSATISHSIDASSATEYKSVAIAPVSVSITDNDKAPIPVGVTITPTNTSAVEGGATGSYKVVLNSQPKAPVTLSFGTDSQIDSISSFTFSTDNWNVAQTATVKAVDDALIEGTHFSAIAPSATSTDLAYNGIGISKVDVLIVDNDAPGIAVSPSNTDATEGGATSSYNVVLTKAPTAAVTINFNPGSQIDAIAPITFNPDNWNVAKTVTVKATDDPVVEGLHSGLILHSVAPGSAAEYQSVAIAPVSVSITENDKASTPAGVTITLVGGSTIISESGTTDTYQVALNSQPNSIVSINFITDSQINAIAPLTFTSDNWNQVQTVTVSAVDDIIVEGSHLSTITPISSSTDLTYNGIGISKVDVLILDNESSPAPIINFSPIINIPPAPSPTPIATPAPIINFSPIINIPPAPSPTPIATPAPIINFSPIINIPPTPSPTPEPVSTPTITTSPTPTPTPTPIINIPPTITTAPIPLSPPPIQDPDCICTQITLPSIGFIPGSNPVQNNALANPALDIVSTTKNDFLLGTNNNDEINGLDGDDVIVALAGNDNLFGGIMSNVPVDSLLDRDLLFGNDGNDRIYGQLSNDTVHAGKGSDAIFGGKDKDLCWGERGNDSIVGGQGDDCLYGGSSSQSDLDRTGNDLLFGSQGNDLLYGQDAQDTLSGGQGDDTARGGKGNDVVLGDLGNDLLYGDQGTDTLCGGDAEDTIFGDIGSLIPAGAVAGQDQICGGSGNDLLFGNEGNDTINGDVGNDSLFGGKDDDSVIGSGGDDWLTGNEGNDFLLGGSGSDRFVLNAEPGSDRIGDFQKGQDLLILTDGLTFAQLSITQGEGGLNASVATEIRIANTGELLAILNGVQAGAIAQLDFALV